MDVGDFNVSINNDLILSRIAFIDFAEQSINAMKIDTFCKIKIKLKLSEREDALLWLLDFASSVR